MHLNLYTGYSVSRKLLHLYLGINFFLARLRNFLSWNWVILRHEKLYDSLGGGGSLWFMGIIFSLNVMAWGRGNHKGLLLLKIFFYNALLSKLPKKAGNLSGDLNFTNILLQIYQSFLQADIFCNQTIKKNFKVH